VQVRTEMLAITVTRGAKVHNKFGQYPHDDMIGMKYGSKVC
jgi:tRNA (adenine57-N1/adenine58-N1)-methyltransferase